MTDITVASATAEIASVTFAAILVWSSVLAQHLSNVANRGAGYAMSDRSVAPEMAGFFGRATRTLANNMESALMYVPATLALVLLGHTSGLSHITAVVYVLARALFTLTYWLKIPVIRSFAWLAGMICCAVMYFIVVAGLFAG